MLLNYYYTKPNSMKVFKRMLITNSQRHKTIKKTHYIEKYQQPTHTIINYFFKFKQFRLQVTMQIVKKHPVTKNFQTPISEGSR